MINRKFRKELRRLYDNQTQASKALGISHGCLSQIIRGKPLTDGELRRLNVHFTEAQLHHFFGKSVIARLEKIVADAKAVIANAQKRKKVEGSKAVNE